MTKKPKVIPIQWIDVKSSNIKRIAYSEPLKVCLVEFHNENVYQYKKFPNPLWLAFKHEKDSLGKFFFKHIKNNKSLEVKKVAEAEYE